MTQVEIGFTSCLAAMEDRGSCNTKTTSLKGGSDTKKTQPEAVTQKAEMKSSPKAVSEVRLCLLRSIFCSCGCVSCGHLLLLRLCLLWL